MINTTIHRNTPAHTNFSPEDLYRAAAFDDPVFGRLDLMESEESFCWCFWKFAVDFDVLKRSHSIQVRAMDEGLALQPRDMVRPWDGRIPPGAHFSRLVLECNVHDEVREPRMFWLKPQS